MTSLRRLREEIRRTKEAHGGTIPASKRCRIERDSIDWRRMNDDTNTIPLYRSHAKDLRMIAFDAKNSETRSVLLAIAGDFEQIADGLESIERINRKQSH
jgi:hypothetical protein